MHILQVQEYKCADISPTRHLVREDAAVDSSDKLPTQVPFGIFRYFHISRVQRALKSFCNNKLSSNVTTDVTIHKIPVYIN
jgi:hypothetical protein